MKYKYARSCGWLLLLPVLSYASDEGSLYNSFFYISPTDYSVAALGQIFGNVGTVIIGSSTLASTMFEYFNYGVFAFTLAIISMTIFWSITATSNQGKILGENINSWVILRSIFGLAALTPQTSGYCAIQVMIMWFITQGIGLANTIWIDAVNLVGEYGGAGNVSITNSNNSTTALQNISIPNQLIDGELGTLSQSSKAQLIYMLESAYCTSAVYQYDKYGTSVNKLTSPNNDDYGVFITNNQVCFGSRELNSDSSDGYDYNCQCGLYKVVSDNNGSFGTDTQLFYENLNYVYDTSTQMYSYALNLYQSVDSINTNQNDATGAGIDIANICQNNSATSCVPATTLVDQATTYNTYINNYQSIESSGDNTSSTCPSWIDDAETYGWMLAPMFYSQLVNINPSSTCAPPATTPWQYFMPYTQSGVVVTVPPSGATTVNNSNNIGPPCMTSTSGYSDSQLCDKNYLSTAVQGNWNSFVRANSSTEYGLLPSTFNSVVAIINSMNASSVSSDTINTDSFNSSFFDPMIKAYLQAILVTPPGSSNSSDILYSTLNISTPRFIVNGLVTLSNFVMGQLLGVNIYNSQSADDLFSFDSTTQPKVSFNPACVQNSSLVCDSVDSCGANSCLYDNGIGMFSQVYAENNGQVYTDPLTSLAQIGRNILKYSVSYFINTSQNLYTDMINVTGTTMGTMAGFAMILSIPGVFGAFAGSTINYIFFGIKIVVDLLFEIYKLVILSWLPIAMSIALIYFTIGSILGVYLPFLPYILFLAGVISWFISVVEAMIAAPLVAMGITHPKGHELMGKAQQATMLLLAVFIRPATIVIGYIAAISLSYVAMRLLNITFTTAYLNLFNSPLTQGRYMMQTLSTIMFATVYAYSCYAILSQCFSLIYQVPDKVIRWLGMPKDGSSRDAATMLGSAKSGFTDSAQGVGSSASDTAKSTIQGASLNISSIKPYKTNKPQIGDSDAEIALGALDDADPDNMNIPAVPVVEEVEEDDLQQQDEDQPVANNVLEANVGGDAAPNNDNIDIAADNDEVDNNVDDAEDQSVSADEEVEEDDLQQQEEEQPVANNILEGSVAGNVAHNHDNIENAADNTAVEDVAAEGDVEEDNLPPQDVERQGEDAVDDIEEDNPPPQDEEQQGEGAADDVEIDEQQHNRRNNDAAGEENNE